MHQRELFPHAATRLARGMMLLALLGAAGCMTGPQALTSPARSYVAGTSAPTTIPGQSECVACEP